MPGTHLTATCFATAGLLCACGGLFARHSDPAALQPVAGQVLVSVENHNWSDMTVYLVAGGAAQRLGMVWALGEARFAVSSHRLDTSRGVRLRALPDAGQPFTSETILVFPGQAILWTLENNLGTSSFSVY